MQSFNRLIEKSKNARRAFTVVELLVASMLLGMLLTILTMIFSQSSIAWRTGLAGEANMSKVRSGVSKFRCQADNAYPDMNGKMKCVRSVFMDDGTVRTDQLIGNFKGGSPVIVEQINDATPSDSFETGKSCSGGSYENSDGNYVVNVKSAGPNRELGDYDDIWSFPDDPGEWCDK